jgi:hypothetical protein
MAEPDKVFKKKVSQMLIKLGEGYIQMGTTPDERQNYLRSVATAWNIACLEPKLRAKALSDTVSKFVEINPDKKDQAVFYEEDMKKLIRRKLKLFPRTKVQVLDVSIHEEEGEEKVRAASLKM